MPQMDQEVLCGRVLIEDLESDDMAYFCLDFHWPLLLSLLCDPGSKSSHFSTQLLIYKLRSLDKVISKVFCRSKLPVILGG